MRYAVSLILLLAVSTAASAQTRDAFASVREDTTVVRMISLRSGSVYHGRIIEIRADSVIVRTEHGTLMINRLDVSRVTDAYAPQGVNAGYWFPNPNATRLLFSPTGRMLKKSDGYFSDYMLFFPGVAVGVTNYLTVGGGMSIFPGDEQVFYFTPKLGLYQSPRVNFAAGALVGTMFDDETAGILYGVGTFGSPDASTTLGLGWGYSGGDVSDRPVLLIGGEYRVSRRVAVVTENWMVPDVDPVVSFGLRFMGERMAVDLALLRPIGADSGDFGLGLPWIDFVINF